MGKVTVLGSGSVGSALAGYYGMKNLDVCLYELPQFEENIKTIKEQEGVKLAGVVEGFGKVKCVTTDMREAIKDAEVIIVTVPAYGHREIALKCAHYLENGQVVAINSGSVFAALEFSNVLKKVGNNADVTIADISNIMGCRKASLGEVNIHGMRNEISVASLTKIHTKFAVDKLHELFDKVTAASGLLEIAINNNSTLMHPTPAILNAGWIESSKDGFDFYWGGISPSVGSVMEAVDLERVEIGKQLGHDSHSFLEIQNKNAKKPFDTIYEYISTNTALGGPKIGSDVCPTSLNYRYITEDVPYGLVPYSEMARQLGLDAPHMDSLIVLASQMNGVDYREEGRNLMKMGIENKDIEDIKKLLIY